MYYCFVIISALWGE